MNRYGTLEKDIDDVYNTKTSGKKSRTPSHKTSNVKQHSTSKTIPPTIHSTISPANRHVTVHTSNNTIPLTSYHVDDHHVFNNISNKTNNTSNKISNTSNKTTKRTNKSSSKHHCSTSCEKSCESCFSGGCNPCQKSHGHRCKKSCKNPCKDLCKKLCASIDSTYVPLRLTHDISPNNISQNIGGSSRITFTCHIENVTANVFNEVVALYIQYGDGIVINLGTLLLQPHDTLTIVHTVTITTAELVVLKTLYEKLIVSAFCGIGEGTTAASAIQVSNVDSASVDVAPPEWIPSPPFLGAVASINVVADTNFDEYGTFQIHLTSGRTSVVNGYELTTYNTTNTGFIITYLNNIILSISTQYVPAMLQGRDAYITWYSPSGIYPNTINYYQPGDASTDINDFIKNLILNYDTRNGPSAPPPGPISINNSTGYYGLVSGLPQNALIFKANILTGEAATNINGGGATIFMTMSLADDSGNLLTMNPVWNDSPYSSTNIYSNSTNPWYFTTMTTYGDNNTPLYANTCLNISIWRYSVILIVPTTFQVVKYTVTPVYYTTEYSYNFESTNQTMVVGLLTGTYNFEAVDVNGNVTALNNIIVTQPTTYNFP